MTVVFDMLGARVSGKGLTLASTRTIWASGHLYVAQASKAGEVTTTRYEAPDDPKKWAGGWKTSGYYIQAPTCGCKKKAVLKALSVDQILGAVHV